MNAESGLHLVAEDAGAASRSADRVDGNASPPILGQDPDQELRAILLGL